MADLAIGQRIPSALDSRYLNYEQWCLERQIQPASFASWIKQEQGHGSNSLATGKGMILKSPREQAAWKRVHSAEIEARRQAALGGGSGAV